MILVDTTVLIDIWRGRPQVKNLIKQLEEESFLISAITIAELYDGIGYTKQKKGNEIYEKVKDQIEKVISGFHIIPVNQQILQDAGSFKGESRAKGIILDIADSIIGITAKLMNVDRIITRNSMHFKDFGIKIESYSII